MAATSAILTPDGCRHDAATAANSRHKALGLDEKHRARLFHQLRDRHWTMLWISTVIVAASYLLHADESGHVAPAWWPNFPLPVLCGSRALFGVECPGCGLTRSFIALARGDLAGSINFHRVGWVLALAVLLQFPYRILALGDLRKGVIERTWPKWFGWALIATLFGSWFGEVAALF
jgi:hypothetical protein